jgi:hypothetical protein
LYYYYYYFFFLIALGTNFPKSVEINANVRRNGYLFGSSTMKLSRKSIELKR